MKDQGNDQNIIKFLKKVRKFVYQFAVLKSFCFFLKTLFSSSTFQFFVHFAAAVFAGALSVQVDSTNSSVSIRWGFVIPFSVAYFIVLLIFNKLNDKNKTHEKDKETEYKLIENINFYLHEITVMQQTAAIDGSSNVLDVISQNVCSAIRDILREYYSCDSFKVTIIKRCFDEKSIRMNGFVGRGEKAPDLYGVDIPINKKTNYDGMSFVKVFKKNMEDGIVLRTEKECLKHLVKNGKNRINTKQFISLPGIVNNQVVVLLQIASKDKEILNDDDFLLIAQTITPIFIQELCNVYMTEKKNDQLNKLLMEV